MNGMGLGTLLAPDLEHLVIGPFPDVLPPGVKGREASGPGAQFHPVKRPVARGIHYCADVPAAVPVQLGTPPTFRPGIPLHTEGAGLLQAAVAAADAFDRHSGFSEHEIVNMGPLPISQGKDLFS